MDDKKRQWPNLIPEPTGDPPLEPVVFGDDKAPQTAENAIDTDPNGSYTGTPTDGSKQPIQDADDL